MNKKSADQHAGVPTLQELESHFQKLRFQLEISISPRVKVRLIANFCHLLVQRERLENNNAYYQELLPEFSTYLNAESLKYQPFDLLLSLHQTLTYIAHSPDIKATDPKYLKSFSALTWQTVAVACYLHEWHLGISILTGNPAQTSRVELVDKIQDINGLLNCPIGKSLSAAERHILDSINDDYKKSYAGFSTREVWIPLVEKWVSNPDETILVGTLYPLHLDLEKRQNNLSQDLIFFNNHQVGLDDLICYQAQDAMMAARTQHSLLRQTKTKRYSVIFGFPLTDYSYSGSSFGYGMSLLSLCALEAESNLRKQHSVNSCKAFTGGIDLKGDLRPVNQDSLAEKILAAFFSPLKAFVLPKDNLDAGLEIVAELKQIYPKKDFELIGESSIGTTLDRDELVEYEIMPFGTWLRNHMTRSKLMQLMAMLLVLVTLASSLYYYYYDPNPASYQLEGENLHFYNKSGKYLWDINLGYAPNSFERNHLGKPKFKQLQIDDYDGDGETEVIIGTADRNRKNSGKLYFIETDGSTKWIYDDHPKLIFSGNEYSDTYATSYMYAYKHRGEKAHDFYVSFTHKPWFPNRILRINTEGEVLNSFIHPGSLYDLEIFDINGDGEMELILGGTNNRFNSAVLGILPSRNFSGSVPSYEDSVSVLDGATIDSALIYMKFPRWGKYDFTETNARSHVANIYVDQEDGFGVNINMSDANGVGSFMYHFEFENLTIDGLTVSDGFLSIYFQKYGRAFFEAFDQNTWQKDMSEISVWKNGKWTPPLNHK